MFNEIKINYIGNSGIFIKYKDTTILIDGIFQKTKYFSSPVNEMQKAVKGMPSIYSNIDYLIFTHRHADHFSSKYLNEYIKNNRIKRIFLTKESEKTNSQALDMGSVLVDNSNQFEEFNLQYGEKMCIELSKECRLSYFRSVHAGGSRYIQIKHYTVVLSINGKQMIFGSDADSIEQNFSPIEMFKNVDMIFVNPLFFNSNKGQNFLDGLTLKKAVIYHIPFSEDDITGLRELVVKDMARYSNRSYEIVALMSKDQTII